MSMDTRYQMKISQVLEYGERQATNLGIHLSEDVAVYIGSTMPDAHVASICEFMCRAYLLGLGMGLAVSKQPDVASMIDRVKIVPGPHEVN